VKRDPRLQPLSDEHHDALVLARRLRRLATTAGAALEDAWADAGRRFDRELEPHFQVEERWLLPALESHGEHDLAERVRAEHLRLRSLIREDAEREPVQAFAILLHDHVRFEERRVFMRAEQVLSPEELARIESAATARSVPEPQRGN